MHLKETIWPNESQNNEFIQFFKNMQGKRVLKNPTFVLIFMKQDNEPVELKSELDELNISIQKECNYSLSLTNVQTSIDKRCILNPISFNFNLLLLPTVQIQFSLDKLPLQIQAADICLLIDVFYYLYYYTANPLKYVQKDDEFPFSLDINFQSIEIFILEDLTKILNFTFNHVSIKSTSASKIKILISSLISYYENQNDAFINCDDETSITFDINKTLQFELSNSISANIKMEQFALFKNILGQKEQILDYEKLNLKKFDFIIQAKFLLVKFFEKHEFAELQLFDITYKLKGAKTRISVDKIAFTDPVQSKLYPAEVIKSAENSSLSLSIKPSRVKIIMNNLIIFVHYHILRRFIHLISFNHKNVNIQFKNIQLIVPVAFKKADEMLQILLDGNMKKDEMFLLDMNTLSANFYQYNGEKYDPIISNLSFKLIKDKTKASFDIKPIDINLALNDIASFNVLIRSLNLFINKENLLIQKSIGKINEVSIESNPVTFILYSDRYKTVPLFKFAIRQISLNYNQKSIISFDHILYNDIENQMWKIFMNAFSINLNIISKEASYAIKADFNDLININFAYRAIQLFLKYIPKIQEMISITELCLSKQPYFKIKNQSTEIVMVKTLKEAAHYEILPDVSQKFQIKRDDEIEIEIGHHRAVFVPAKLHYPIFVNNQTISQTLTESGTTITVSPFLYFENQVECSLYLLNQKTVMTFENILEIPAGKKVPYTDLDNIRNTSFALTSDKEAIISRHSLFTMKQIKNHPILFEVDLPNKNKKKLIVVCKFNSKLSNLVIKIQPNCIIRNQLPYHLFIKPVGYNCLLHVKPGDKLRTTAIDVLQTEFIAKFATSDSSHFKNDALLSEKVCVKVADGSVSPVPFNLNTKNKAHDVFNNVSFTIEAKSCISKPRIDLICYPPTVVFNYSGFEIECYSNLDHKQEKIGKFAPIEANSDPTTNGYFFWCTEQYLNGNQHSLPLYLSTTEEIERKLCYANVSTEIGVISKPRKVGTKNQRYISSNFIDCMIPYINGLILIPTANPFLSVLLHYVVEPTIPHSNSTRVLITNQVSICNQSDAPFYIQPIILPDDDIDNNVNEIDKKHKIHHHKHIHKLKTHKSKNNLNEIATESSKIDEDTSFSESTSSQLDSNYMQIGLEYGESITIPNDGKLIPIRLVSNGLLFAFKIDPLSVIYTTLNFSEPVNTTFAISGVLFELKIELTNHETIVIIKKAIFPQPLNVLNDLEIGSPDIFVTQKLASKEDVKWINTIPPQTMSIMAYDDPFGETDIFLHYQNEAIPIDIIKVNSRYKLEDIFFEVRTINNTKAIFISKSQEDDDKHFDFSFSINIPTICVSIIDKLNREFALFTINQIALTYETGETNKCEFKVFSLEFDDLTPASSFKVVAACFPNVKDESQLQNNNAVELLFSLCPKSKWLQNCDTISLSIAPIYLFIDISFVSDFILLLESILIPANKTVRSLFTPTTIKSTTIYPFSAASLTINEIQFIIMVRNQTPRPSLIGTIMTFFKYIPDMTNQKIILPCFHFEGCTANTAYLQKEVLNPIADSFLKQMYKLLYNIDLNNDKIGTKCACFVKMREIYNDGHLNTLVEVPGSIFLHGGELFINLGSKYMRDQIEKLSETRSFHMITNTTKHQKIELQKTYTDTYFDFLANKLIQIENDPIKGIYDASIQTFNKLIAVDNPILIPPIRVAHAFPMFELSTYTKNMKALKDVSQFAFQQSEIYFNFKSFMEFI